MSTRRSLRSSDVAVEEAQEGRIFFSNRGRSLEVEDEITLVSVGIDIGSSTTHLAFSRLFLERLDTRYIVVERILFHQSAMLLTPYIGKDTIDAAALGLFIESQYQAAAISPADVDTGVLILTGVAVQRSNARAIGDIFSAQAGKFVVVSAGDALEATLAAFGSGAVARSARERRSVLNVDIGGGTSKLAICEQGAIRCISALDIGARIIAFDENRRITRLEDAGVYFGRRAGRELALGAQLSSLDAQTIAGHMVEDLFRAMRGDTSFVGSHSLYRLPPLPADFVPDVITVSGGVSEFLYHDAQADFGDLGPTLAHQLRHKLECWTPQLEAPEQGIRATVIGASQYTVQVSGSTIFVEPMSLLPLRNLPVIKPLYDIDDNIDAEQLASAVRKALMQWRGDGVVAVYYVWSGPATWARVERFCRGMISGMAGILSSGHPLVLVGRGDVGGLIGIHCHVEHGVSAVVSIDGIELEELNFIDIGSVLPASGAAPVVVKSLVFPARD